MVEVGAVPRTAAGMPVEVWIEAFDRLRVSAIT